MYLQEIGRVDLLNSEMEIALAKKIKEEAHDSQRALEILVKANLRFVVSVAKQYQNQGLSLGDLINEGNLGLIKAARRFDETRGFKFISYAVWWIRQSILQALAEQSRIVRLPLNRVGALNKISRKFSSSNKSSNASPLRTSLPKSSICPQQRSQKPCGFPVVTSRSISHSPLVRITDFSTSSRICSNPHLTPC